MSYQIIAALLLATSRTGMSVRVMPVARLSAELYAAVSANLASAGLGAPRA